MMSRKSIRRDVCAVGIACAYLLLMFARDSFAADGSKPKPIESQPYRVFLGVAFEAPLISKADQIDLLDQTVLAARRYVGDMWQTHAESVGWVHPVDASGLRRLDVASIETRVNISKLPQDEKSDEPVRESADVWFVATVKDVRPGYRIDVRSWLPELQVATEPIGVHVADPRELPITLLRLCRLVFRPIGLVEEVEGNLAKIRLRAGAFPAPDVAFAVAHERDTFTAVLASRSKDRKIDRLQSIPWTVLSASSVVGDQMTCEIGSGLRSPLGGKQRGRVETLVVGIRSQHPASRLELATQTKPSLPLMAHRIELRDSPKMPQPDDEAGRQEHLIRELITDRRGTVLIPSDPERPFVWLFAYSGKQLLARVPFVPGSSANVRLEVPDDSSRLTTEADIQILQGSLVDAVARRNTAIAEIRLLAKKEDWKNVRSRMDELPKLPNATLFLERLAAIRVPGVTAAKTRKDRAGEARVNKLCDDTDALIKLYLSEDKLKNLREEIAELEKVSLEAAAENAPQPAQKKPDAVKPPASKPETPATSPPAVPTPPAKPRIGF